LKFIFKPAWITIFKPVILSWSIVFCMCYNLQALPADDSLIVPRVTSTQQQAIEYINTIKELKTSAFWPNINPVLFLRNLKANIHDPIDVYAGNGTYFCGYGALTYLFLKDDPLGYAKLLLQLFRNGKATFGKVAFDPSDAIKKAAGAIKYTGRLDINPAEQMWYLTLAGHYKGYLNIFNRKYDPEDENNFWASVNYAKFNRMVRQLLKYTSRSKGSDIKRPYINNLFTYINERMKTGTVVLFINNRIVHKKNHVQLKPGVPTHFIVAEKISIQNDMITLRYWDYGRKTQLQLSTAFFNRIIFGITYFTKKETTRE
jgi:hypothetical protein